MRPDQRTKLASDIYKIFEDRFLNVEHVALEDGQTYCEILEEIEQYIAEKIG